jgi:hypothetical protein
MDRQPVEHLYLSSDGNRLLSISGGMSLVSVKNRPNYHRFDYIIWNTTTGKILWNTSLSNYYHPETILYYQDATISPDGRYFINIDNNSIISVESGKITHFSGTYYYWTVNGKYFITVQGELVIIWDTTNFTKIKTILINETIRKVILTPDKSKLIVELHNQTMNSIQVIDVVTGNSTCIYNYSVDGEYNIQYLILSNDFKKLQMIKYESSSHSINNYLLIIWNITNKKILYNDTFKTESSKNTLIDAEFGKYIIFNATKSQLIVYNLTSIVTILNVQQKYFSFSLSYDESIMCIGDKGVIEIRNSTTGRLLNSLRTPVYEIKRSIPGFEIVILIGAMALVIFWKRKRRDSK